MIEKSNKLQSLLCRHKHENKLGKRLGRCIFETKSIKKLNKIRREIYFTLGVDGKEKVCIKTTKINKSHCLLNSLHN